MPTYTCFCPTNGRSVDVLHAMRTTHRTWGEVCDAEGEDPGPTPPDTGVEKLLGTGMVLTYKRSEFKNCDVSPIAGGCCGGGCGPR